MTMELDAGVLPDATRTAVPTDLMREGPPAVASGSSLLFVGRGSGYFRIWIVNLLLTIVTLGIYSPWAKVRRLRYFYGNTLVDGSPFEFHGRPMALLKGRVIGLVLLAAYTQAAKISLACWLGVLVVLIALLPWLLWKSLRFRFANSSYRGIRFAFDGTLAQAYLTFIPLMMMVLAPSLLTIAIGAAMDRNEADRTLGRFYACVGVALLFAPWFYFRLRAYQHRHARLGSMPFTFEARVRSAYGLSIRVALLMFGFCLLGMIVTGVLLAASTFVGVSRATHRMGISAAICYGAGYLVILSGLSQPIAMVQNFVWNHSALGGAPLRSDVERSRVWRILIVNLVLTFGTAGLFWPFAVVRMARYRIGSLSWSGDSNAVMAATVETRIGAAGEETAELFGLDIAV